MVREAAGYACSSDGRHRTPTEAILDEFHLHSAEIELASVRLRYFARMVARAPPILLALLQDTPVRVKGAAGRPPGWALSGRTYAGFRASA